MVIFRIITNLTRILLRLALRLLALPLFILKRNLFLAFLIGLGIYLYVQFSGDESEAPATVTTDATLTPAPAEPPKPKKKKGKEPQVIIEPVQKREDGNSAFASDLYKMMTDEERAYYSHIFFWSMNRLADGQVQSWDNGNMYGSIRLGKSFTNKRGDRCRPFSERLKVRTIEQTLSGTACERGGGAWCKLKPNATPACNLGGKAGFWQSMTRWFSDIF